MGTGKRYLFKDFPGPTVTLSFRVPENVSMLLTEAVAEADGIGSRTEALQDAMVKWIMLEELERSRRAEEEPRAPVAEQSPA